MSNRIYVRGDTHGSYDWLEKFCQDEQTDYSDILILLGDHALRFEGYNNRREVHSWEPIDLFMKGVSKVDSRTEKWLEEIKDTINFDHWYHDNREINDKATMLYEEVRRIV